MIEVQSLDVPDVKLIETRKFADARGFFSETYNFEDLREAGIDDVFVQDNISHSNDVGVVRGLHFQNPPRAQAKLIRVLRGRIFDVALDIRKDSATFGRHTACTLSAEDWSQLYVPAGFAHGFAVLDPHTEVHYKASDVYTPETEGGVLWCDPELGIDWPVEVGEAITTDRDKAWSGWAEFSDQSPF